MITIIYRSDFMVGKIQIRCRECIIRSAEDSHTRPNIRPFTRAWVISLLSNGSYLAACTVSVLSTKPKSITIGPGTMIYMFAPSMRYNAFVIRNQFVLRMELSKFRVCCTCYSLRLISVSKLSFRTF